MNKLDNLDKSELLKLKSDIDEQLEAIERDKFDVVSSRKDSVSSAYEAAQVFLNHKKSNK